MRMFWGQNIFIILTVQDSYFFFISWSTSPGCMYIVIKELGNNKINKNKGGKKRNFDNLRRIGYILCFVHIE